jgi:hypothetical protein
MATQNVWTYQLEQATMQIDDTFNLTAISMMCAKGYVEIIGLDTAGGLPSSTVRLSEGQTLTISTLGSLNSLQINIDANNGICNIIGIK